MRKARWCVCGCVVLLVALAVVVLRYEAQPVQAVGQAKSARAMNPNLVALRIQLGLKDKQNSTWDGSIEVSPGKVVGLEIWRKGRQDEVEGNSFKVGTRPAPRFTGRAQRGKKFPPSENGFLVTLEGVDESSEVTVRTQGGEFSFKLAEVPFGKRLVRLDGAADVIRIPASYHLTADGTEEDYPAAAAGRDGTVWVAYMAFTHGKDFAKRLVFADEEPEDLSMLAQPTGGDQVLVMRLSGGRWSDPMPVTPGGEDLYKTAIAVDGDGRPWVFWSGQSDGNFDLYASTLADGRWSTPVRLTRDPGPDINPAAAADSAGRVWVTWQGFRGDNSDIFAMRQQGNRMSAEMVVSAEPGNQWAPAIAVCASGAVAVAWDTYARGNYDVYFRVAEGGERFGPAVPAAASLAQEVHASVAYDRDGRLWVAWEQGPEKWGKDYGALVRGKGSPLYGGGPRTIAVKCFAGDQPLETVGDLTAAIGEGTATPLGLPRLAVDAAGRVWLAYRCRAPHFWCRVGTVWFGYLTCYRGDEWLDPIYVHDSDNILDNRPALVPLDEGSLLLVRSADGRQTVAGYPRNAPETTAPVGVKADPINNDLFVSLLGPPTEKAAAPRLAPIAAEVPAGPVGAAEEEAVAGCRSYRLQIAGKSLRLMRGEFHRHTELSVDGRGDGSLIDMYRYALDAAAMDWIGNGDHDNNNGREYPWWITQKTVDAYKVGTSFVPMFSYERSVSYPDGHRNPVFARRGIRTLPRFGKPGTGSDNQQPAHTPDTLLLYRYLEEFDGLCAVHTSATGMGTDWRDNNPKVEPIVEIYQGCRQNYEEPGAPRAPSADDARGGWRPAGFIWRALEKGYRLGFQSSSDHVSTHISYCNVWAEEPTREAIFRAMKRRHVYGSTDNIIADVRCGEQMMGDEFATSERPTIEVKLIGTAPFKRVDIVKDNAYVYTTASGRSQAGFTWTDMNPTPGTSYYYVRGEQEDGELVWVSPMWITYGGKR